MSPFATNVLILFFGLAVIASAIVDLIIARRSRRFVATLCGLAVFALLLHLTTGFPEARYQFGPNEELLAVIIMLIAVVAGMGANHLFFSDAPFVLRKFAKPAAISPIVLLPLLGLLQGANLDAMQYVYFAFLAFQNGFFWQRVLADAKPKT